MSIFRKTSMYVAIALAINISTTNCMWNASNVARPQGKAASSWTPLLHKYKYPLMIGAVSTGLYWLYKYNQYKNVKKAQKQIRLQEMADTQNELLLTIPDWWSNRLYFLSMTSFPVIPNQETQKGMAVAELIPHDIQRYINISSSAGNIQDNDFKPNLDLKEELRSMNISEFKDLITYIRSTLKIFVPHETIKELELENASVFVKKDAVFSRLLTYQKLQKVIKEKKLTHVRLPIKYLVIQDKKTGQYITGSAAEKIIDDIIKISVGRNSDSMKLLAEVGVDKNQDYDLIVFASRQTRLEKLLSQQAYNELQILIKEAKFDVGCWNRARNIFTDDKGNAIIIDTEYKGAGDEASQKLTDRYPVEKI